MKWRLAGLIGAVGVTAAVAACGTSGSGDGAPTPTQTTPPSSQTPPPTSPTPTPTPSGPVYLDFFHTPDGTAKMPLGKCLGFTVVGNGVTFPATGTTVKVGPLGSVPVKWLDPTHVRVGSPATNDTCVYTPIFSGEPGMWDVSVNVAGTPYEFPQAIEVDAPQIFYGGYVEKTRVFTSDRVLDAGANTFEQNYDVDVYKVDFTEAYRMYPHLDFFDMGTKSLVPKLEFWNTKWPDAPLGVGADAVIFPEGGTEYFVVRDVQGHGGPGADYDLGIIGDELAWIPDASGCDAAQPITAGGYHIDDANLSNRFDPDNNGYCVDSTFGDSIKAPGPDAAFTITVPAGKELRAASYDNHWSQAIYLLPRTSSCDPMPTDCVRAVGHFGGGNTNDLIYDNTGSTDLDFYLIFDTTFVKGTSDGAFLVNVEILDPK